MATDTTYTITVNGTEYELNDELRAHIEARAEAEFAENEHFSCFWTTASPDMYESTSEWEDTVHEAGDPLLVIETFGKTVPMEKLDQFSMQMETATEDNSDASVDGSGQVEMVQLDEMQDVSRTHFGLSPQQFEEVPSPEGLEDDRIPEAPVQMPDHPLLVLWVPEDEQVEHTWETGEAIAPVNSWVEWNPQVRATQPRTGSDRKTWANHWESLCEHFDCPVVQTDVATSDTTDPTQNDIGGKYGGNNFQV